MTEDGSEKWQPYTKDFSWILDGIDEGIVDFPCANIMVEVHNVIHPHPFHFVPHRLRPFHKIPMIENESAVSKPEIDYAFVNTI
jgi:hypothetical protein